MRLFPQNLIGLIGVFGMLGIGGAMAQDPEVHPHQLLTGQDITGWSGVGRLNIAGGIMCSGALIADDLVLTAAHCMFDPDSREQFLPQDIEFLADFRQGRASAVRRARRIEILPDYDRLDSNREQIQHDIAVLQLDRPIRNRSVTPFLLGQSPGRGDEVGVVSYAHDRAESPALEAACKVKARDKMVLVLTCSVDVGSSGAPVFRMDDGTARIVSVVSAVGEFMNQRVSISAVLDDRIEDLLAVINAQAEPDTRENPGLLQIRPGAQTPGTGAKFLRP